MDSYQRAKDARNKISSKSRPDSWASGQEHVTTEAEQERNNGPRRENDSHAQKPGWIAGHHDVHDGAIDQSGN